MDIRVQKHAKFPTKSEAGTQNGYLVPLYNVNDNFFRSGKEPKQVYLAVVDPGAKKGPHLHHIRTGFFTCIKGNVKIVLKTPDGYKELFSGERYEYLSVEIPVGIPALMINCFDEPAFVINMPSPAWTPIMSDEHTSDFGDYENN